MTPGSQNPRRPSHPGPAAGPSSHLTPHEQADAHLTRRMILRLHKEMATAFSLTSNAPDDLDPEFLATIAANLAERCLMINKSIKAELLERRQCSNTPET